MITSHENQEFVKSYNLSSHFIVALGKLTKEVYHALIHKEPVTLMNICLKYCLCFYLKVVIFSFF